MHLFVLFFPLMSSILAGLFGRKLGTFYCGLLTVYCLFYSFLLSLLFFLKTLFYPTLNVVELGLWFSVDLYDINWNFLFDSISITMFLVITFISFLVHLYSLGYLDDDPSLNRFLSYLSLFTFFMLLFTMSSNYVQMFIGWEGVGLVSYLLINFWYNRYPANRAALKAIIVNRIGDFFFIFSILLIWTFFGNCDFLYLINLQLVGNYYNVPVELVNSNWINLISLFLFLAAMVKSAQFGFHTWLPDAMEGPTPVSALLHAATMVTAGVFLVIRSSFFIDAATGIDSFMLIIGAITTFFASFTAFFHFDVKKIIAYSTCAQLGLMFVSCALGNYILALFHLFNHAFFKALLFLSAGILIHGTNDEQDIRKTGDIMNQFPIVFYAFFIGSLSLAGTPFLTGFYSKELIVNSLLISYRTNTDIAIWFVLLGTFFTAAYSVRLIILLFFAMQNQVPARTVYIHETSRAELLTPIFILTICSIVIGYIASPIFISPESDFWKNSLIDHHVTFSGIYTELLSPGLKVLPLILTISGALFALFFQVNYPEDFAISLLNKLADLRTQNLPELKDMHFFQLVQRAFFFDYIYYYVIVKPSLTISYIIFYRVYEKKIFELLGPEGILRIFHVVTNEVNLNQEDLNDDALSSLYTIIFLWIIVLEFFL